MIKMSKMITVMFSDVFTKEEMVHSESVGRELAIGLATYLYDHDLLTFKEREMPKGMGSEVTCSIKIEIKKDE